VFLNPLGLLALLGVPAIVALHLFRRRFRPHAVSALFLWRDDDETLLAGRKRERLRTSRSFWLEVLAACLLGLVFAGPRGCGSGEAEHLVCVLDASASMGARTADGRTLREEAVELVRERIGDLDARSRITLIESGARARLLAGPAAFPAEASSALANYRPGAARHALGPAVALGLQLSGAGAVLVVTDHFDPDGFPPEVELVALGASTPNVAITHAARTRDEVSGGDRLLVTVTALTRADVTAELAIRAGEAELQRQAIELEPDRRRHFAFGVPAGTGPVEVVLLDGTGRGDALAIDDHVHLAPLPARTLALASTLDEDAARLLGLASGRTSSPVDRLLALVPASIEAPPATAHLLVGRDLAAAGPRTWTLSLATRPAEDEPRDLIGPFLLERRHALLDGVTLEGVVWSAGASAAVPGTPLVSAGDLPLLTEEVLDARRAFTLNLDPVRSSVQRSPDWPILLANLAELRRAELPGPARANVAVGESFVYRARGAGTYRVRALDPALAGTEPEPAPARDVLVLEGLDRPGFYALERDGEEVCRFGVSFKDPRESDLRGMASGRREPEVQLSLTLAAMGPLALALLFVAALALALDWWVLHGARRPRLAEEER
jgi:hypothetical protein